MSAIRDRIRSNLASISIDNPDQYKAYLTITGSIILHVLTGANQLGNIITYMTSYMNKYVSREITYSKDLWFTTISVLAFTIFTIIGGYSIRVIPLRGVLFIGVALISLGNYICSFALDKSFLSVILAVGFIQPAGSGFVYTHSIIVSSKWFPTHRGFITGLIVALDSIATFITMILQTEYLNPDNKPAAIDGYIKDDDVLHRLPVYYRFASLLYLLVGAVGVLFTFEAPPGNAIVSQASRSQLTDENRPLLQDSSDDSGRLDGIDEEDDNVLNAASTIKDFIENDVIGAFEEEIDGSAGDSLPRNRQDPQSPQNLQNPEPPKKNYFGVRKALRTRMAMILFITFGLSTLSSYFISIMAKPYGQFINDDKFLALIVSLGNFANFVGSFFCGKLMDRIKFKHTMLIINCTVAASYFSLICCQYYQSRALYASWIILINFASIGFFTSHLPEVMNKFGDKHSSAIYGVIHIGPVISALLFSPMLEEMINTFSINEGLMLGQIHYGYYYAFLLIGFLNFISMVILMIFYRTNTVI